MNAHTPTPWNCVHNRGDTDFCLIGTKREDGSVPLIAVVMRKLGEIEQLGNIVNARSANGEFIARACNAHDELVAAVKDWRTYVDNNVVSEAGDALLAKLDALLVKAQGHGLSGEACQ